LKTVSTHTNDIKPTAFCPDGILTNFQKYFLDAFTIYPPFAFGKPDKEHPALKKY
jgi:hypothetical protein